MRRNMFGDPRPKGYAEMVEAIDERNPEGFEMNAEISHDDDADEPWKGYLAEVRGAEDGDEIFTTLGYAERDDLVKDLKAAGINSIADL